MDIEFNKHACAYASVHIFLLRKILNLHDLLIYSRSLFVKNLVSYLCYLLEKDGNTWENYYL